jgi:linoleoyl-CoA desaturase
MLKVSYQIVRGEVYKDLNQKVEAYFNDKKLVKEGNRPLHILALILFLSFIGVYFGWILVTQSAWLSILFGVVLGILAGILGAFGHEATHRAFAKEKWVNNLMLYFSDFVGRSSYKYGQVHAMHHTYTNVDEQDPDIQLQPILRVHPHQKQYFYHKFQHIYAVFVYGLAAFHTVYNFGSYFNFFKNKNWRLKSVFWISKIWHILFFLVVPIWLLGWQNGIAGYLSFMVSAGLYFSAIIQPSHLFSESEFTQPNPETNKLEEEWTVRMIAATSNYSNGNKRLSIFYAGMDYHIIHQIFPQISMVHYPELNKIIREYCHQKGLNYVEHKNLPQALVNHFKFLHKMGQS